MQGIAIVYAQQRLSLERGVKGLLSDLNGDNLWNSVLKDKQAQLRRERREAAGEANPRRVRFPGEGQAAGQGGSLPRLDQITDLRSLLDFTKKRLRFLDAVHNPEEAHNENAREDLGADGLGLELPGAIDLYHERRAADSMRYSQGSNDGADFQQLMDASFDDMMRDGGFPGHEGNQNLKEFLVRR